MPLLVACFFVNGPLPTLIPAAEVRNTISREKSKISHKNTVNILIAATLYFAAARFRLALLDFAPSATFYFEFLYLAAAPYQKSCQI